MTGTVATRVRCVHCTGFCIALLWLGACGKSPTSPSALNLTGTWSGLLGQAQSGSALRMTWAATQAGDKVVGPATLVKPAVNVPVSGSLAGSLSGNQLTLTFTIVGSGPPGSLVCTALGSGSATATTSAISGTLSVSFTQTCFDAGLEPPGSNQLTLSR